MPRLRQSLALLLTSALVLGCGERIPTQYYEQKEHEGAVDTSLPPNVQARQDALVRFLFALKRNWSGYDGLAEEVPDVRFADSEQEFYDGFIRLRSWNWDGPPQGDDFPVVLVLEKDEPGFPTTEVHRVYTITKSGSQFVIQRKKA